nr:MAG TPA: hypothetical protein [Caudoviricetes sp.]
MNTQIVSTWIQALFHLLQKTADALHPKAHHNG